MTTLEIALLGTTIIASSAALFFNRMWGKALEATKDQLLATSNVMTALREECRVASARADRLERSIRERGLRPDDLSRRPGGVQTPWPTPKMPAPVERGPYLERRRSSPHVVHSAPAAQQPDTTTPLVTGMLLGGMMGRSHASHADSARSTEQDSAPMPAAPEPAPYVPPYEPPTVSHEMPSSGSYDSGSSSSYDNGSSSYDSGGSSFSGD